MRWSTLRYGAILVELDNGRARSLSSEAARLPERWIPKLPDALIRDQGERPTCVAMAAATLADITNRAVEPYSAEHLYFLSKARDQTPSTCGTYLWAATQALSEVLLVRNDQWSYTPRGSCEDLRSGIPTGLNATRPGATLRTRAISPRDVDALKRELASGGSVACTFEVRPSFDSTESWRTGTISMPATHEMPAPLGHAGVLWGYVDDRVVAGGGHFLFQNSRGPGWGSDGLVGAGHGTIPYEYLRLYGSEAFAA